LKSGEKDAIPVGLLKSVVQAVMPHYQLKALEMAVEIGQSIYLGGNWSTFIPIARLYS
jgi:hypothetical protein